MSFLIHRSVVPGTAVTMEEHPGPVPYQRFRKDEAMQALHMKDASRLESDGRLIIPTSVKPQD
jgi:hypothetical protein